MSNELNLLELLSRHEMEQDEAEQFVKAYPAMVEKINDEELDAVITQRLKKPADDLALRFAHHGCAVYAEAMLDNLIDRYDAQLTVLYDNDEPVHFLAKVFDNDEQELYLDAYGAYDNIDEIVARYSSCTITEVVTVDYDDDEESQEMELLRDATLEFVDNFDFEEIADEHGIHYTEFYSDYLKTLFAANLRTIYAHSTSAN
uniref:hypothetical protein n=1 Tax=Thaumasiovibrio occultus TaxID=1891184 RepID=UPI000B35D88C|nr:hypothetical protein [Thaumasiovibrio occultus]